MWPALCYKIHNLKKITFSSRYYANTETYLKAVALKRMPPNLQAVDMLKAGKMTISVFFLCLQWSLTSILNPLFYCNPSAGALPGLFCVSAGEGAARKYSDRAWNGWTEVLVLSFKVLFMCCHSAKFPAGGSVATSPLCDVIFAWHWHSRKAFFCLYQRLCCGSWRGLPAPDAVSHCSASGLKWSCAVNLNTSG